MTNVVKLFIRLINSQNCTCSEEYTLSVHSNNRLHQKSKTVTLSLNSVNCLYQQVHKFCD